MIWQYGFCLSLGMVNNGCFSHLIVQIKKSISAERENLWNLVFTITKNSNNFLWKFTEIKTCFNSISISLNWEPKTFSITKKKKHKWINGLRNWREASFKNFIQLFSTSKTNEEEEEFLMKNYLHLLTGKGIMWITR